MGYLRKVVSVFLFVKYLDKKNTKCVLGSIGFLVDSVFFCLVFCWFQDHFLGFLVVSSFLMVSAFFSHLFRVGYPEIRHQLLASNV